MSSREKQVDWDEIYAGVKALRAKTGPEALAAHANVLALLDEELARCLARAGCDPAAVARLRQLAAQLRAQVERLEQQALRAGPERNPRFPPFSNN